MRIPPETISELQEMSNQKTLLMEVSFGSETGPGRRRATEFLADLHFGAPGIYDVKFIVDVMVMLSIDYMESVRDGVRRMGPYLGAQTTKIGLRKVALSLSLSLSLSRSPTPLYYVYGMWGDSYFSARPADMAGHSQERVLASGHSS